MKKAEASNGDSGSSSYLHSSDEDDKDSDKDDKVVDVDEDCKGE